MSSVDLLMSYWPGCSASRRWVRRALASVSRGVALVHVGAVGVSDFSDLEPQALEGFEDVSSVRLFEERINQPATWNALFADARSDYVGILNADDYWLDGGLEALADELDANPAASVAYGDFVLQKNEGPWPGSTGNVMPASTPIDESPVPGPFALFRSSMARQLVVDGRLWDESLTRCADWHLWARLRQLGPFVQAPRVVGVFASRPDQLSRNAPDVFRAEQQRVRDFARGIRCV